MPCCVENGALKDHQYHVVTRYPEEVFEGCLHVRQAAVESLDSGLGGWKRGVERLGTDHLGADHLGTDHLGTDHLGTDHLGTMRMPAAMILASKRRAIPMGYSFDFMRTLQWVLSMVQSTFRKEGISKP